MYGGRINAIYFTKKKSINKILVKRFPFDLYFCARKVKLHYPKDYYRNRGYDCCARKSVEKDTLFEGYFIF